jgi:hypothetical protein
MSEKKAGKPVRVGYYYKIKWGYQDEFIRLFKKNHYPVLKAQKESGRLLEILAYEPRFHGDGKSDWTFLSVLVFRDWQALNESQEKDIIKKMFPDQETFQREEQRRFELMEAHWDVPLRELSMEDL